MTPYTPLLLALSLWTSILIVELIRGFRRRLIEKRRFDEMMGGLRAQKTRPQTFYASKSQMETLKSLNPVANKKTSLEDYPVEYLL